MTRVRRCVGNTGLDHVAADAVGGELHGDGANQCFERHLRGRYGGVALPRECVAFARQAKDPRRGREQIAIEEPLSPAQQARPHTEYRACEVILVEQSVRGVAGRRRDRVQAVLACEQQFVRGGHQCFGSDAQLLGQRSTRRALLALLGNDELQVPERDRVQQDPNAARVAQPGLDLVEQAWY